MKPNDLPGELENIIDRHSLSAVLLALEVVCGEKADHIRANWQDKTLAREWDKYSKRMGKQSRETHL